MHSFVKCNTTHLLVSGSFLCPVLQNSNIYSGTAQEVYYGSVAGDSRQNLSFSECLSYSRRGFASLLA